MKSNILVFQQQYIKKPLLVEDVQDASAKNIFMRMIKAHHPDYLDILAQKYVNKSFPRDVDDFERCRSMLLNYPEFRVRLEEMKNLNRVWYELVENWSILEELYLLDYKEYGNKGFEVGKCDYLIRSIVCDNNKETHHPQCRRKNMYDSWIKSKEGCSWCDCTD